MIINDSWRLHFESIYESPHVRQKNFSKGQKSDGMINWHSKAGKAKFKTPYKVLGHMQVTKSRDTFPNITNPALGPYKYY